MNKHNCVKNLALALGSAALLWGTTILKAGDPVPATAAAAIRANAGTTFVTVFGADGGITHTVDGVADVSILGNCRVHFDVVGRLPPSPDQPIVVSGTLTITAASGTTLRASVEGAVVFGEAGFATSITM